MSKKHHRSHSRTNGKFETFIRSVLSDLWPCVLDIWVKRGADPSTDQHLVDSLWNAAQAVDEAKTWVWEEFGDFD